MLMLRSKSIEVTSAMSPVSSSRTTTTSVNSRVIATTSAGVDPASACVNGQSSTILRSLCV